MIAKVIAAKARGRTFRGLVEYVAAGNQLQRPRGRDFDAVVHYVGRQESVDIHSGLPVAKAIAIETQGVVSLASAPAEMAAVASVCRRLRKAPDYHLVLSWRDGETPDPVQAFRAGRHALSAIGMEQHQYVMAVHADTANAHVHIAVNRVHPQSYKAVSPYRDYIKLDRAMREIELQQGWAHDRGIATATERGVVVKFKPQTHSAGTLGAAPISSKARDFATWTGRQPFSEFVRCAAPTLQTALSGDDVTLHDVERTLGLFGLVLRRKGSGLVAVHREDHTLIAKASQIARFMSLANLERRVGPIGDRIPKLEIVRTTHDGVDSAPIVQKSEVFEEIESAPTSRTYAKQDARAIAVAEDGAITRRQLIADYELQQRATATSTLRWQQQKATEDSRWQAICYARVCRREALREQGLKAKDAAAIANLERARERTTFRLQVSLERAILRRELADARRESWREFVRERAYAGDQAAIVALRGLRYCDRRKELADDRASGLRGSGREKVIKAEFRGLTSRTERNGDISYRWDATEEEAFRDRGPHIVFENWKDANASVGMELASLKWGNTIELTGSPEYKRRAVSIAVALGMRVSNPDLQDLQRQLLGRQESASQSADRRAASEREPAVANPWDSEHDFGRQR